MANKNTKLARKHGFASMKDMQTNGTKTYKGDCCDTSWGNKNSKKRSRKNYSKRPVSEIVD